MARVCDGWVWNGKRYDDEGQSGETIDRPGLQRLLADVLRFERDRPRSERDPYGSFRTPESRSKNLQISD
jgi:hypothetical protein